MATLEEIIELHGCNTYKGTIVICKDCPLNTCTYGVAIPIKVLLL